MEGIALGSILDNWEDTFGMPKQALVDVVYLVRLNYPSQKFFSDSLRAESVE